MSWYALTLAYTSAKWNYVSPNHRRGIAEALTDATEVMLTVDESPYARDEIRRALRSWAFSTRLQGESEPPADLADVVRWLESATIPLEELARPGSGTLRTRLLLDRISRKKDGTIAAANTANRKRMVLGSVMDYACETGVLAINPLKRVKWARPRALKTVDPRIVINVDQAQRLLAAIRAQGSRGERLVAFFACMYYAALRPEETIGLRRSHLVNLPAHGWGEMQLTHAEPRSGSHWTDNGRSRERRELKHRAVGDTRSMPIHPELAQLLRAHLDTFGAGRDGRVFVGPRGGTVAEMDLPGGLSPGAQGGIHRRRNPVAAGRDPLCPPACGCINVAERRCGGAPGCRVGGAQRGGTAAGLCQMHSRSARRGQAAHLASHSTERNRHKSVINFGHHFGTASRICLPGTAHSRSRHGSKRVDSH